LLTGAGAAPIRAQWLRPAAHLSRPASFEDVVASINPIVDDQPDTPAHWSVTFGVDDADATAAKATELG
jgi:predicted enzyme related to lactoylglutathione lyase